MFCRKCGKEIPDDSEFCNKCGAKVESKPEQKNSELWLYNDAVNKMNSAKSVSEFETVENIFKSLGEYKDSVELLKKCRDKKIPLIYEYAVDLMNSAQSYEDFQSAAENFKAAGNYKDSDEHLKKCEYNIMLWIYNDGYKKYNAAESSDDFKAAEELFDSIPGFENSDEFKKKCREKINEITYNEAVDEMNAAETDEEFTAAAELFKSIRGYKDADDLVEKCEFNKKALVYNDALEKVRFARADFELKYFSDVFRSLGDFKDAPFMVQWCENLLSGKASLAIASFPEKAVLFSNKPAALDNSEVIPEKKNLETALYCPNCGAEIIAPETGFCPYCFADFKCSPILVKEKSEANPKKNSTSLNEDIENFEVTIDKSASRRSNLGISTEIQNESKNIKCTGCGQTLYSWNSRCPKCGTPKMGADFRNEVSSKKDFEVEYGSMKIYLNVAGFIIMAVITVILFASGHMSCASSNEYQYDASALYIIVGSAVTLAVLRGIILLVYKATHKIN